jgi:WD40 repeat protein
VEPSPAFHFPNPKIENHKGSYLSSFFETNGIVPDVVKVHFITSSCNLCKPQILYSASGDNNAYAWDLAEQKQIGTFKGHSGYLHCIVQRSNQQILTGSEDGTIKLWGIQHCFHFLLI